MFLHEKPESNLLVAGIDEISTYNHNLTRLRGDYRLTPTNNTDLYNTSAQGSIDGEGVVAFYLNTKHEGALAKVIAIHGFTDLTPDIAKQAEACIAKAGLQPADIDVIVLGENGDNRLASCYQSLEEQFSDATCVRYKHLCGDYPTASAFGLWVALQLQSNPTPTHLLKRQAANNKPPKNVLIYNTYRVEQHGFILIQFSSS
jgi:3-oxoacyl-[acyl-carrier-protein] synthase II